MNSYDRDAEQDGGAKDLCCLVFMQMQVGEA